MTDQLTTTARDFAAAIPASVELPAGAGKTQLLATTVRELVAEGARVLVLTHTNAGVHAIRKRLKAFGAAPGYTVATITSFAFTLARPYPTLAELEVPSVPDWVHSTMYVEAANRVSSSIHIQRVLRASFTHILVDEYQDCSRVQHQLVCTLAVAVPSVGVLGDRMQAIFGFADALVPWPEVQARFPDYAVPQRPWRWQGHNEPLGEWLLALRTKLAPRQVVNLSKAALPPGVTFAPVTHTTRIPVLKKLGNTTWPQDETVLVITGPGPAQTRSAAANLSGRFSAMEEIGGGFMHKKLAELAVCDPSKYANWLVKTTKECFCGHAGLDAPLIDRLDRGQPVAGLTRPKLTSALGALDMILEKRTLASVAAAMDGVRNATALSLHSHEAWSDIQTAIRGAAAAGNDPEVLIYELAKARDRIRHAGRTDRRRVVSRTLLVKGLEYDHVIIANVADIADQHNLYVALSRARKSITILGATSQLLVKETSLEPKMPKKP